jgi:prepilin-type N-terminal cleavage/methylation domain-containing protein
MRSNQNKTGFTLVEMLIVVAMVVILTTIVIGLAGRIDNQSKEQLTKNTIGIIAAALRQFRDYKYRYEAPIYAGFDFPLDCTFLNDADIGNTVAGAMGATNVLVSGGALNPEFSTGEGLYFFLSQVPECRKTLDRIDESLITNLGDVTNKQPRIITITYPGGITKEYPLLRIIDPWGTTLRYEYYDNTTLNPHSKRTFPVITSAGPDRQFGNTDDISSRK